MDMRSLDCSGHGGTCSKFICQVLQAVKFSEFFDRRVHGLNVLDRDPGRQVVGFLEDKPSSPANTAVEDFRGFAEDLFWTAGHQVGNLDTALDLDILAHFVAQRLEADRKTGVETSTLSSLTRVGK